MGSVFFSPPQEHLFIALPIPDKVQIVLQATLQKYPQHIERLVPPERWHLTLVWLGTTSRQTTTIPHLTEPLPQAFLPTVSITHVGRGLARGQLWAYAHPTNVLQNLRQAILERLGQLGWRLPTQVVRQPYVPHIHIADLYNLTRRLGMADEVASVTFAPAAAHLYRSRRTAKTVKYVVETAIPLADRHNIPARQTSH